MEIRPYLTFNGNCNEALDLYKDAFNTEIIQVLRFKDLPANPNFKMDPSYDEKVVQATLKFGDNFIRLSDCGPNGNLNLTKTEGISIVVEATVEEIKHAFSILSKEGTIGMPLEETFYSPLAGVVFDKFGIMWNLVTRKENTKQVKKAPSSGKARHKWTKEISGITFTASYRNGSGSAIWRKSKELVLLAGAKLTVDPQLNQDGSLNYSALVGEKLRSDHADKVKGNITTEDIVFPSPNMLGLFLFYGGQNTWAELKDENGKSLDDWSKVE